MSEQLGEALLVLRTVDQGLASGVAEAKTKAEALGGTLDQTSGAAARTGQAMTAAGGSAGKFSQAVGAANASVGAHRAGMMQLSQQLGDAATMYAMGARPVQIFTSQIGQAIGAVQLMAGGTSRLATFLGGPWGMALTTATILLGPLVAKLFETESAMTQVKFASDAMGDAQGILGRVMDLTTGKINTQNAALIALAKAQLAVAQVQAQQRAAEARRGVQALQDRPLESTGGMGGGLWLGRRQVDARDAISQQVLAGTLDPMVAMDRLKNLRNAGVLNDEQYTSAVASIGNLGMEEQNIKTFKAGEDALNGKGLGALAKSGPSRSSGRASSRSGPSAAEIEQQYAQELGKLNQEELRARMDLAEDAGERLAISQEILASERQARIAEIEADKNFTAAQKKAQIAVIERIYGKAGMVGADGITVDGKPGLLGLRATRDFEREDARLKNDMLSREAETLRALAQIAPDSKARAELERRALDLHQEIERAMLEEAIARGQVADAAKARALLAQQQAAARESADQDAAGPLDRYTRSLRLTRNARGELVETLIVDELEYFNQAIDNAIMSRLGIKDPLLAGLIDLFIKDVLIRPIAEALSQARSQSGGGGGGIFGSLLGALFGGGGGGGFSPSAGLVSSVAATMDDPAYAGLFADGGLIPSGGWGIVGEAGPEPVFATSGGVGVLPNSALRRISGGASAPGKIEVTVSGARGNAEIQQMVAAGVQQGLSAYDKVVGSRVQDNLARYG